MGSDTAGLFSKGCRWHGSHSAGVAMLRVCWSTTTGGAHSIRINILPRHISLPLIWANPRDTSFIWGVSAAQKRASARRLPRSLKARRTAARRQIRKRRRLASCSFPAPRRYKGEACQQSHGHTCPFSQLGFRMGAIPGIPQLWWRKETYLMLLNRLPEGNSFCRVFLFFSSLSGVENVAHKSVGGNKS